MSVIINLALRRITMSFSKLFGSVPPRMTDNTLSVLINDDQTPEQVSVFLIATRNFLTKTAPEFRADREGWQTENDRKNIIDNIANALSDFKIKASIEPALKPCYESCKSTILDRLDKLKQTDDLIFKHYQNTDNALKNFLTENPHHHVGQHHHL